MSVIRAIRRRYKMVTRVSTRPASAWRLVYSLLDFAPWTSNMKFEVPALDTQVWVRLGAKSSDLQILDEIVRGEYDFNYPSRVSSIMDLGANVGYSALWFHKRYPEAQIICVEPDSANCKQLIRNVEGIGQIVLIRAAIGLEPGIVSLQDPGRRSSGLRTFETEQPARPIGWVPSLSLGDLVRLAPTSRVDILKIDIEGAELELLSDSDTWRCSVASVVVETHERFRPGCDHAWNIFTAGWYVAQPNGPTRFALAEEV